MNLFMSENHPIQSICVYCGSADGVRQEYYQAAFAMGQALAHAKVRLIYGAGKTGLMGAVADGALQAGGEVVGIMPANLNLPQLTHTGLTGLEIVENIQIRQARMSELADAFIALPGGYGTLDELFECLTWAQIGLHQKPIGLLNTLDYYNPLLAMVQHALEEGFIYAEHRILLVQAGEPAELLTRLHQFEAPGNLDRWVNR